MQAGRVSIHAIKPTGFQHIRAVQSAGKTSKSIRKTHTTWVVVGVISECAVGSVPPDSLLQLLQTLRHKLNCTLPVEVAYIGSKKEMDPAAIAALNSTLGPVHGLDLSAVPYPAHHNLWVTHEVHADCSIFFLFFLLRKCAARPLG